MLNPKPGSSEEEEEEVSVISSKALIFPDTLCQHRTNKKSGNPLQESTGPPKYIDTIYLPKGGVAS